MKYVLQAAIFLLMVSVGMGLSLPELRNSLRRLTFSVWMRLLLATFLVPPAVALLLARIFPLDLSETAGLFMVAVAPGAPLMTRNVAKRGFDMHLAAVYQVWGALLIPVMIPLLVAAAGKLYGRDIWVSPWLLLYQIVEKQFLPLLCGMALMYFAPAFSQRTQPAINRAGNLILVLLFAVLLVKMGPALRTITPWLMVAAFLLVVACAAAVRLLLTREAVAARTLAICNVNRHVGLALLLSGQYLQRRDALPAIACYALVAVAAMVLYPKLFRPWQDAPAKEKAGAGRVNF